MASNAPVTESSNGTSTPAAIIPTAANNSTLSRMSKESGGNPEGSIAAFSSQSAFEAAQRMAKALAASSLMPTAYQNNVPNCLIAMEMASRIGASVFMVAQNLDVIHGKPSFSSKFLIATVNQSNRFSPLRFRYFGTENTDSWGCRAVATDKSDGEPCIGPLVTIGIAKAEGWYNKNGSKWKTLPELMLMYRAAGFWTRVYCPELSLGMQTSEEIIDTTGYTVAETARPFQGPAAPLPGASKSLEDALLQESSAPKASDSAPGRSGVEWDGSGEVPGTDQ